MRATDSLEPSAMAARSVDLLHIPTPWHNCVVEVAGSPFLFVTKSGVVDQAVKAGVLTGGWVPGSAGRGGYFRLEDAATSPVHDESEFSSTETLVEELPEPIAEKAAKSALSEAVLFDTVVKEDIILAIDQHLAAPKLTVLALADNKQTARKSWNKAITHCIRLVRRRRQLIEERTHT